MFSGIIETLGTVKNLQREQENCHISIECPFTQELKIDQSIAHNGVCLTVVHIGGNQYTVTAIKETLNKSNLTLLKAGDLLNLERCIRVGDRLDGHIVQGHVDCTATCKSMKEQGGSYLFSFEYDREKEDNMRITVEKGSVCVNGVSLTVVDSKENGFSVAIIPYTFQYTNFKALKPGDIVNLEFDVLGKYIARLYRRHYS